MEQSYLELLKEELDNHTKFKRIIPRKKKSKMMDFILTGLIFDCL